MKDKKVTWGEIIIITYTYTKSKLRRYNATNNLIDVKHLIKFHKFL